MGDHAEVMNCPVCGQGLGRRWASHPYLNVGPHANPTFDGLTLIGCDACESSWATPAPSNEDLGTYYRESYSPGRMGMIVRNQWPIWDSRHASLMVLSRLFATYQEGNLFVDLGPGNGASLSLAPLLLPRPRIGCVELNQTSIQYFRKRLPDLIIAESLEQLVVSIGPAQIKLVLSSHSLEHFRPQALMGELGRIYDGLSTGGVLALEVPYSPNGKTFRVRRHSPHLIFFSEQGLRHLIARAGFDVKLCFKAVGRTKWGQEHVRKHFTVPSSYPRLSERFLERVAAMNVGDLVASDSTPEDARGVVLKCIAVKQG